MKPNTSCPSATVEQALCSTHAWSDDSPPSQGLVSAAPGSRSRSPAVRDGSLSVHGRATSQSVPSSFFPAQQAPAASPFPAPLGGQPWQGLGLPSCPLAALEQIAARPQSLLSLLSPMTGSGALPPRSSDDYLVGIDQLSSHSELPPLPASLRIPSLEEASTYSIAGGSMPNLTTGSMLPMMPPPSHGAGASSNFTGFTQPSSNSELAPLPASLQTPLVPVKQDVIRHSMPENNSAEALSLETTVLKPPVESRSSNVSSTRVTGSTPCHDRSSSRDVDNSSSTPKLSQAPLPPSAPVTGASSSHSRSHVTAGVIFSDAEKEIIRKDKSLQELVDTDPKRVKRNLSIRVSAAKRKAVKDTHTLELKCKVEALQRQYITLSAEVKSWQERCAELDEGNKELSMTIKDLEQQAMQKDAKNERLKAKLRALIRIKLKQCK